ncbi:alpha/beta fold hydrolase [Nonomuraea pusilla]|uniref:Alpha/beta hydrolase fold n=1 Tax=Nonomuraea pusilla TaxID=46177 RepID=A0A1H8HW14_9ACTN|nr:alpha/beta fold hydrolase [Nonomuraea pusilla]SEN60590.1 alpha/beta hydrolase fold [Nonomuraea pusilla]
MPTSTVPGATLYYEAQGSGPVLLMIPGGPADAGVFAGLAARLADRYTVVAYDPRGNSRSAVADPSLDQDMDVHADDAARLLAELGDEPAYVLGSSGGAQIGLNLAARHPERVRVLVAHEPPCVRLLPDGEEVRAGMREVYETYRADGVQAGMARFEALAGMRRRTPDNLGGPSPAGAGAAPGAGPGAALAAMVARIGGNLDYFLARGLRPISDFVPDVAALRDGAPRIVVGVGAESEGQLAHRCGLALAERLGTAPVVFPGDHGGYGPKAAEFAVTLDRTLTG